MMKENHMAEQSEIIQHKLKKDGYARERGGGSEFLDIYCSSCQSHIALYQKDGSGSLLRMYLDRIFEPENLANLQDSFSKSSLPSLRCSSCETLIAVPMVYKLENRLAFRLIRGSFFKRKSDGTYPPF
jgi:ribosomal protein S27E